MYGNMSLIGYLTGLPAAPRHRPWPRFDLDPIAWADLLHQLAVCDWQVLSLWGEADRVHVALRDEENGDVAVVTLACPDHRYASLSGIRPSATRLERMVYELWGLAPAGLLDPRPWLDHGRWGQRLPLAARPQPASDHPYSYDFLPVEGESLHQIPVGPVHAGVIEPGHFRFTCAGETVVRLEERLGYVHKGIEALMAGKTVADAARLAARVSGDSTVAYSLAFARAVEAALDVTVPPRIHWLRAVAAELERVANHLFDIGAICNDVAFSLMLAECTTLRESVLRLNQQVFGHRLLMDVVQPGAARDLSPVGAAALRTLVHGLGPRFDELVELYDSMPSLLDRTVGTGVVAASLAHRFGAGGFVGRAASQSVDARCQPGYPPYDQLDVRVSVHAEGDVNARLWVRIDEVRESLRLLEAMVEKMPAGPVAVALPPHTGGEGMALVEGFRGEILLWLRLGADGRVERCHPRDPSWFQWPLLEAAIENNIVADFPVCNKSFNCSYSGHDL